MSRQFCLFLYSVMFMLVTRSGYKNFRRFYAAKITLLLVCFVAGVGQVQSGALVEKVIAGRIEHVSLGVRPSFVVKAKLDTGATTSSIHAENVHGFSKNGQNWVRFDLVLHNEKGDQFRQTLEQPLKRKVRIKNHDGNHDLRYVVVLDICFDGRMRRSSFTLADRTEFNYQVLLGREFLNGLAIVDPEKTYITHATCHESINNSGK